VSRLPEALDFLIRPSLCGETRVFRHHFGDGAVRQRFNVWNSSTVIPPVAIRMAVRLAVWGRKPESWDPDPNEMKTAPVQAQSLSTRAVPLCSKEHTGAVPLRRTPQS
jgi:hypothetical protein